MGMPSARIGTGSFLSSPPTTQGCPPTSRAMLNSPYGNYDAKAFLQDEYRQLEVEHDRFRPDVAPQLYQASMLPINASKNRYCDILPQDHSRVIITGTDSDYINANWAVDDENSSTQYAPQPFILSQAPTVSSMNDFYHALFGYKIPIVVCLTKLEECGRIKANRYWPTSTSDSLTLGSWTLTMSSEESFLGGTLFKRSINMVLKQPGSLTTASHSFTMFHYTAWCDQSTPCSISAMVKLMNAVREAATNESTPGQPILVHCSAGVGRAGTFVATYNLRLLQEQNSPVTPFEMVNWLRSRRHGAVQTFEQYLYIHEALIFCQTAQIGEDCENNDSNEFGIDLRTTQWNLSPSTVYVR